MILNLPLKPGTVRCYRPGLSSGGSEEFPGGRGGDPPCAKAQQGRGSAGQGRVLFHTCHAPAALLSGRESPVVTKAPEGVPVDAGGDPCSRQEGFLQQTLLHLNFQDFTRHRQ